ncbi:MAG: succinyl-diaminopimelate desuccinylase [Nitriliruptoraceae bacterium]
MEDDISLHDELTARLLEHTAIMAVTGYEGPIADAVEHHYRQRGDDTRRIGHSLVVRPPPSPFAASAAPTDRPLVLLVGHLDVVAPTQDDETPRVEGRDGMTLVVARGASDMKSGNVVAMSLFERDDLRATGRFDLGLILYAGEEGPADGNELASVLDTNPELSTAALAIVLEPTDGRVELGCLGGLHARLTFHGQQAHSARPWQGDNALTAAARFLVALSDADVVDVTVDDVDYRDVWTATQAWTDQTTGRNVVPGHCTVNLNFRFAPSRSIEEAERELRERVAAVADRRVDIQIIDRAPPASPRRYSAAVAEFVDAAIAAGGTVSGKQAWTDVARFAEIGVPALNFGPGLTGQAHQRGEYVPIDAMVAAYTTLERFLSQDA